MVPTHFFQTKNTKQISYLNKDAFFLLINFLFVKILNIMKDNIKFPQRSLVSFYFLNLLKIIIQTSMKKYCL